MVGQHKLHKQVYIIACGNLETDNAIVNTMSSALISRFAHFQIQLNNKDWQEWAIENGIDTTITAFLNFKPDLLYTFDSNSTEPYASPRTWEMVNRIVSKNKSPSLVVLASLLGDGVANEYLAFLKHYKELPKIDDILANPDSYPVPTDLSVQWASIAMVLNHVETHTKECVTYLQRFPLELHRVALAEIKVRNKLLLANPDVKNWIFEVGKKAKVF